MAKFKENQSVIIKGTGDKGRVTRVLYNPYVPKWLSSPNYLVLIEGREDEEPHVITEKQLKKIK